MIYKTLITPFGSTVRKGKHGTDFFHISEICDAEPSVTPRGCPFQTWSLGESLRLERNVS
jgi:glycogen debranching enzyme